LGSVNRTLTPSPLFCSWRGKYAEYTQQYLTWTGYDIRQTETVTTLPKTVHVYYDFSGNVCFGWQLLHLGTVVTYTVIVPQLGPKWRYWTSGNAGIDTPYGTWPLGTWWSHYILADDKIYVRAGHDYTHQCLGCEALPHKRFTGTNLSSLSFDIGSSPLSLTATWFGSMAMIIKSIHMKGPSAKQLMYNPLVSDGNQRISR
jgi:hypothetical protein